MNISADIIYASGGLVGLLVLLVLVVVILKVVNKI
jgi:hypothetical protein